MQQLTRVTRTNQPGFICRRFLSSSTISKQPWRPGPAPPRLPKEEQEIFEKLQQQSTGAFSTPRAPEQAESESSETSNSDGTQTLASSRSSKADKMLDMFRERARVFAEGDGEKLHPNVRRGAAPEFEGDTNPKTGEVGGPKNEPLRWGVGGDWSYNGRVTDF